MSVTLPEEEWVRVLNMLATFPFKDVAPTLQQIQQQLQIQVEQAKRDTANLPIPAPQRVNGQLTESAAPGA